MPGMKRKQTATTPEETPPTKRAKLSKPLPSCGNGDVIACPARDNDAKRLGKLSKFRISKPTRRTLKERGVKQLFPIQYLSFDSVYDGKDLIGQARTGTGKTLSFVLPLLEKLSAEGSTRNYQGRPPLVLTMTPTRELAIQVHKEFKGLAPTSLSSYCIYGGAAYEPQESAMQSGIDILVGTPGRILDHVTRGSLDLSELRHVVLDEADQMLERGFADTVEEILAAAFNHAENAKPQMLLFSATVPDWVLETAERYMSEDRVVIDLIGQETVRTAVTVEHKAICCPYAERPATIADVIQVYSGAQGRTMIFCQKKQEVNELALSSALKQDCQMLHGDIPQRQREITLKGFREGKFPVLVATDVAARGLDVPEVDLVIQCEPPKDIDAYIHRSGRTGRAGRMGLSVLFYKPQQEFMIPEVERVAGVRFQRIGAPQPGDVIGAGARDAVKSLDTIPSSILAHFKKAADQLIDERGATNALAAALACISGARAICTRSLLSAQQGYTTYHLHGDREIRHIGYFWKILEQNFPPEVKEGVKGMRMSKDSKGVVFDLPNEFSSCIKEHWEDGYVKLQVATTLPELKERPPDFYERMKYNSRGGNGYRRTTGHNGWFGGRQQLTNGERRKQFSSKF